jgi:hypothetical protein
MHCKIKPEKPKANDSRKEPGQCAGLDTQKMPTASTDFWIFVILYNESITILL